ncbi:MAG TPA: ATP-binding protein, partial [Streptosporangiaceae bacterium]|nr:ATP-binding protein [Streptosporangiaceae bacterium]
MTTIPVLGDGIAGPWFRVVSLTAPRPAGSAEQDFAGILPAALAAAGRNRPFVAGWLSRGAGSPLELITNAAASEPAHPSPAPPPGVPQQAGEALLYPPGSRGVPAGPGWLAAWDSLVWVLCPGRQAPPLAGPAARPAPEPAQPTLFEAALAALTGRPFGWLVVAEPTELLDAEIAELRTQVNVLRRHDEEQSRFGAERTQRRLAELDAFREAGLWEVRVLAGAATQADAALLAPVLAG